MKKMLLIFLACLGFTVILNFGLWNVFFQQDEWYWFGRALIIQKNDIPAIFQLAGFHFNPFSTFLFYVFYRIFSIHWQWYAFFDLFLHSLNATILFILVKSVFKNKYVAFFSTLFFMAANVSQQAVTWYGASLQVLPTVTCGLLSLLFFYKYYERGENLSLMLSYFLLFFGLGFKEDSMFLFLVYGSALVFFKKIRSKKSLFTIAGLGFLYFLIRGIVQKLGTENPLSHINLISYIFSTSINAIYIPLTSFSQLYFSPLMIYNLGRFLVKGHEIFFARFSPYHNVEILIETTFFYIVTISLTFLFLISLAALSFISKRKERNTILLLLLFIFLSFTPFFLLPKGFGMESRHYYFPMVGGSVLLAYVIAKFWGLLKKMEYKYAFAGFLLLYFIYNFLLDRQQVEQVIGLSIPRIKFIDQLQTKYKRVVGPTIFLSQGDTLPFQSGMGQMLMVIFDKNYQYNTLLQANVLWDMGSQGYAKKNNEAFGYFSDKNILQASYSKSSIPLSHIYSFSWDNTKMILTDTSTNTRKELAE